MTPDLAVARELVAREFGLAIVVYRSDGSTVTSVVNAGVLDHPVTGDPVVAFVVRGHAMKRRHLRREPRATVVSRVGWGWAAVEGLVDLAGPNDQLDGLAAQDLLRLLRSAYAAALGGSGDDWAALDAEMASEGHTAALLRTVRVYGAPRDTPST